MTGRKQGFGEVRADESRPPGDERSHSTEWVTGRASSRTPSPPGCAAALAAASREIQTWTRAKTMNPMISRLPQLMLPSSRAIEIARVLRCV